MRRLLTALTALALALAVWAPTALAAFEFEEVGLSFEAKDGTPVTQAGSHPFAMTNLLSVTTVEPPGGGEFPSGEIRDLRIDLPEGFAGDPSATPRCSNADFAAIDPGTKRNDCPDSAAVGFAEIEVGFGAREQLISPVYNLQPAPGNVAKLGFVVSTGGVPVTIDVGLSEEPPYHVIAKLTDVSQAVLFYASKVTLWGNPASPEHDEDRGSCVEKPTGSCPTSSPERPFLTLPTACTGPLSTLFHALAWNSGEEANATATTPPGITGCGKLGFAPLAKAQPTSAAAESPSGLDFKLEIEDEGLKSPSGLAQSAVKKAVVTLPEGMTINPSQAEGLGVCTEADLARESASSEAGEGCPNAAKIGTVEVETPLLEGEILKGSLFVAAPYANPFDSLIALYMVFRDRELGIVVKQPLEVEPDPATGQLITTAEGLPQLPFSEFRLHFREGGRSPLVTPPACGTYAVEAVLTPYANPTTPYTTASSFQVTSGPGGAPCPAAGVPPFAPGFAAGSASNAAGRYSPFYMRLTRADGEQDMTRFSSILPPGVTGKIAGLAQCPQAAIEAAKARPGLAERAAPSCPEASRIGRTLTGAGVGPELTYVPGSLYLAGPYHGAPLSVAAIVPAVAGPFDVGTVVVQEGLDLNPATAEVEVSGAASDPIPHILAGIPLKVRDLRVFVERPGFTLNPTSCEPLTTRATLFGGFADVFSAADDLPVDLTARYQAADCASLAFKPRLFLKLRGGTRRSAHPALRSVLVPREGDANIGRAVVTLPPSEFIDNAHINNPCTRVQFNADACPKSSILGTARATTPLLDAPLEGPVYFRSNGGERNLPDIVADLKGQFRVILVGFVDSKNARIRTTFANPPDAPVTKFQLNLFGGKRGLLVNSRDLCKAKLRARLALSGQNGRRSNSNPVVKTSCKKGKGKARARRASHRRR
ncbi:MAG TPA: hypothetical protein VFG66_07895 [Gemmatimonadales bacterium]|nr:hypothetical protein [Gemmatimonadales bacterium]